LLAESGQAVQPRRGGSAVSPGRKPRVRAENKSEPQSGDAVVAQSLRGGTSEYPWRQRLPCSSHLPLAHFSKNISRPVSAVTQQDGSGAGALIPAYSQNPHTA